jgi:hypothetical protein
MKLIKPIVYISISIVNSLIYLKPNKITDSSYALHTRIGYPADSNSLEKFKSSTCITNSFLPYIRQLDLSILHLNQ